MDSVQYNYLRRNKYFLCSIGLWPYQSLLEKILFGIVVIPCISAQTIFQGGGAVAALNVGDIDAFMESVAPFVISVMCICKFVNFLYNHKKMKNLLNVMRDDWQIHREFPNEYDILSRHYTLAKKATTTYAVALYGSMTPFMAMPSLLNIADRLGYYNLSNGRPLMFRIEHLVDAEKHYNLLLIHSYFGTVMFIMMVVAVDTIIMFYIQHECGLCEILGQRLQNIVESDSMDLDLHPNNYEDKAYQNVRKCIILHKHIINFARTVEDANTTSYFFQLGFNMLGVSFTEYQAVANLQNPGTSLRFASFTICLLSVLFILSWPGQQLSDYAERISEYTTSGKWYQTSIRTRKLLGIMLLKSRTPLELTALGLYTLNIENFSSVRFSFAFYNISYYIIMNNYLVRMFPDLMQMMIDVIFNYNNVCVLWGAGMSTDSLLIPIATRDLNRDAKNQRGRQSVNIEQPCSNISANT
ncbi:odorant receptor 13a [Calliopsis andreniformis]|uniref:odorant receptor 13a n=1 Tax=Calliopsis andreniformis TaxID=337506 RepID=UPI003FCEA5C9